MADGLQLAPALSAREAGTSGETPVAQAAGVVDAGLGQLLSWTFLAVLNQLLIVALLPTADGKTRLLHHAYDAAQLLVLGALAWGGVRLFGLSRLRWPRSWLQRAWTGPVLTAVAVFLVGLLTGAGDVANLAERKELPRWLLTAGLAFGFATVLGGSRMLKVPASRSLRIALAFVGVTLAVANALSLKRDYFTTHLMLAWLSALLLSRSVEGLRLRRATGAHERVVAAIAAALGILSLAFPARGDARLRLYALPSSVLAPLTAGLLQDEHALTAGRPGGKHANSAWFRDRSQLPPVPASRAIAPTKPPIVMFFTIDAFRADVMENAEYREAWPELNRLRHESSYFTVARAPTASTMTTMASVFAGKYYSQLKWGPDKAEPLLEPTPRFPELLSQHGVKTLLVGGTLGRIYGKSGVARGFAKEVVVRDKRRPATTTIDAIITELDAHADGPQFIYAHFIEPHAPYDLAGKKGTKFERYRREIGLVDRQLARLRAYLLEKGLADRTYLLISADHGEGFGEHGTYNHARTAYEELVRVPLFFYLPGRAGRSLDVQVTLMDVGPSVLDLFGLPTPGFWMGQSLLPLVAGKTRALERPVVVDTGRQLQALCFDDGLKVIFERPKHTTEVYDLRSDPGELRNLADKGDARADAAIQTAELFFRAIARPGADGEARE